MRRGPMRLMGAGAADLVAGCGRAEDQVAVPAPVKPAATSTAQPVIRTILDDIAPDTLGDHVFRYKPRLRSTVPAARSSPNHTM